MLRMTLQSCLSTPSFYTVGGLSVGNIWDSNAVCLISLCGCTLSFVTSALFGYFKQS